MHTRSTISDQVKSFFEEATPTAELPEKTSETMTGLLDPGVTSPDSVLTTKDNALLPIVPDAKQNPIISIYVVKSGDTLNGIAKLFDVSVNTILWSNDLSRNDSLKVGQTLVILPVTGISYKVAKGDTIESIAKHFSADTGDIKSFNNLLGNSDLVIGDTIVIPDGEIPAPKATVNSSTKSGSKTTAPIRTGGGNGALQPVGVKRNDNGYFIKPIKGAIKTQSLHGYNGIDLTSSAGVNTPIIASAAGTVIISKNSGYNGGYGSYVVISHPNGMQTLYGHMSQVLVSVGQQVSQGDVIGKMGRTGRATGLHLHFEVRGGVNPF